MLIRHLINELRVFEGYKNIINERYLIFASLELIGISSIFPDLSSILRAQYFVSFIQLFLLDKNLVSLLIGGISELADCL